MDANAPEGLRTAGARWRLLAAKAFRSQLAWVLDGQPDLMHVGPVAVGREVTGWRHVTWGGENQVSFGARFVGEVEVGFGTRIGQASHVAGPVRIGRFGSIGAQAGLLGTDAHPLETAAMYSSTPLLDGRRKQLEQRRFQEVGHDVWIGHGATLLGGVRVGNGAVIGANAVVNRDVPPFTIVVGSPARELRRRFAPEIVDLLEEWAWWELDPAQLVDFEETLAIDLTAEPERGADALRDAIRVRPEPAPRQPVPIRKEPTIFTVVRDRWRASMGGVTRP